MAYRTRIGPLTYFDGAKGPRHVNVLVQLTPDALDADLKEASRSMVNQFLLIKHMAKPQNKEELAAILAFACAQEATIAFSGGALVTSALVGSEGEFSIQTTHANPPERNADFRDDKCSAWCEGSRQ